MNSGRSVLRSVYKGLVYYYRHGVLILDKEDHVRLV